ncbi:MAG TPA: glycosyl hydrolase family 17 protein [Verrucomicrobiae bacterium]|nr:glycosyl hydrolase family 17 protein [Verrucomicrobiae bacterium]
MNTFSVFSNVRSFFGPGVMLAVVVASWQQTLGQTNNAMSKAGTIRQTKADLLAGCSEGAAYSGFRHGQHPDRGNGAANPSDAEILDDLKILARNSNFGLIRLYDAQTNSETVLRLIKANGIKVKVMLGAWLSAEVSNPHCSWLKTPIPQAVLDANKGKNEEEIKRAIRLAKEYPGIVVAVNVGNEALVDWNDHMVSVDSVISYVREVKRAIHQPVTVADNYAWWAKNGEALAKELDFVTVHTYPEWEGEEIDAALSRSIADLEAVHAALPKSRLVIGEAGWATVASEFGKRASEANQKRYVDELTAWAKQQNVTTFIFEAFDEDWKGDASDLQGAEKHWGLFTVDRKPKLVMQQLYPDAIPATTKE